jgi:hypothetical protein
MTYPATALERVASAQQVSEASLVATRGEADKILQADWNPVLESQLITPGRSSVGEAWPLRQPPSRTASA